MNLIPLFLLIGMLAVSGWAEDAKPEPYSPELVKKAEAGDAKAQRWLVTCYARGIGVTQDYKEAVKWSTKLAEQGDWEAQIGLGYCYAEGKGVTKDENEAVKWYMKSAEHWDRRPAVEWLTKAAKEGNAKARDALKTLKPETELIIPNDY